jgi:hypothetical protein
MSEVKRMTDEERLDLIRNLVQGALACGNAKSPGFAAGTLAFLLARIDAEVAGRAEEKARAESKNAQIDALQEQLLKEKARADRSEGVMASDPRIIDGLVVKKTEELRSFIHRHLGYSYEYVVEAVAKRDAAAYRAGMLAEGMRRCQYCQRGIPLDNEGQWHHTDHDCTVICSAWHTREAIAAHDKAMAEKGQGDGDPGPR